MNPRRRARLHFALSLCAFGLLLRTAAALADGTTQCDRTSSLGGAVDQCPNHVNPCCLARVESGPIRYQIMRDSAPTSPVAVLIVALTDLDGRTSAEYTTPPIVAFWNEGWKAAQRYLPAVSSDRPTFALAMNAGPTRGYNRLHLHISCASSKVLAEIHRHVFSPESWTSIVLPGIDAQHVPGRTFRVRIIVTLADPFSVVADSATPDLQNHAMALVGGAPGGGWYLLDRTMGPSDPRLSGYIEDVLDETCGGRALRS